MHAHMQDRLQGVWQDKQHCMHGHFTPRDHEALELCPVCRRAAHQHCQEEAPIFLEGYAADLRMLMSCCRPANRTELNSFMVPVHEMPMLAVL